MSALDELIVPQPPYRMPRPTAVLAMAEDVPGQQAAAMPGEEPVSPAEAIEQRDAAVEAAAAESERGPGSPAEAAGEAALAVESQAAAARAQIEQAPALPEEPAEGPASKQAAQARVDEASADASARVQAVAGRSYETLEDFEKERERLEAIAKEDPESPRGKIAMKGAFLLAPRISEMRAKRDADAAAAAESALRAEQEERARKEDIEFKKSVTRAQSAALKEDAAREEQKLAAGIEFPQTEENAAERVRRLGQEALRALNDFRNAQDRGAKPEEVEFARQRAAITQENVDAAKSGAPVPERRVDMAKVEQKRLEREIGEARSFDELYDIIRGSGEDLVDSRGNSLDAAQQVSILEHFRATGEMYMKVPGGRQRPTRALGILAKAVQLRDGEQAGARAQEKADDAAQARAADEGMPEAPADGSERVNIKPGTPEGDAVAAARAAAEEAEPLVEAEPALGTKNERGEEVVGYSAEGKAVWMLPEEAAPQPAEAEEVAVSRLRPAEQQVRPEEVGRQTEAPAPESAPASAAEQSPTPRERRLEEELARLRAEFDAYRRGRTPQAEAGGAGGGERPPGGAAEAGGESEPEPAAPGEGERQLAELGIDDMGDTERPGWWEQQGIRLEATVHDFGSYWWSIWAKRAKDSLKKRDKKIKDLEKKAKTYSEGSWLGTAISPLRYGPRIVWQKWRKGLLEAAQARHDARRVVHENYRNDLLNGLAQRYDTALATYQEQANAYADRSRELDQQLDGIDNRLRDIVLQIARERSPAEKERLIAERDALREVYDELAQARRDIDASWKDRLKDGETLQSAKNQVLKYAKLPGPDTQPGPRERLKTRQKREPNQPNRIAA